MDDFFIWLYRYGSRLYRFFWGDSQIFEGHIIDQANVFTHSSYIHETRAIA